MLPRATLVDLYRRTVNAHQHLSQIWHEAVAQRFNATVADDIRNAGWPRRAAGASDEELFYDDLRFIVAATELQPTMLTVAQRDDAQTPTELSADRSWFGLLLRLGATRGPAESSGKPRWVGRPHALVAWLRGQGIQLGFALLLEAWQASQAGRPLPFDIPAFETRLQTEFDEKQLALIWNYAALAYMLGTDRWYTQIKKRYGDSTAQSLEKSVWLDRGGAEDDLRIGVEAMALRGTNVESLLRGFQFSPGEVGILDVEFELKDENHGIMTHHRCPALDRFEHFDESRLRHCCEICLVGMPLSGEMLNENITCKPLKLPPRVDENDIACRWEYTLRKSR